MLVIYFFFSATFSSICGESTDCFDERLKNASLQIVTTSEGELKSTNWTSGESYDLKCKNSSTVWVNGVRRNSGVDVDNLDRYVGTKQSGNIVVLCKEGTFHPDIFSEQKVWCSEGCQPLPTDNDRYWEVTYSLDSLTTDNSSPPVLMSDTVVKLACRSGYAPRQITKNVTKTKCSGGTWEDMEKFIECVPGCEDITEEIGGRKSLVQKRSGSYAPFVAGDTVTFECGTGKLVGNSTLTCTSLNTWYPDLPVCSSSSMTFSGILLEHSFRYLVLIFSVVIWNEPGFK
ncbi:hypothetical protein ACHWQZ_G004302 [Mnemiopsis leidyi]